MAQHIDPNKSARENILDLVNQANSSDLSLTDVDLRAISEIEGVGEGVKNTTLLLDPLADGRFSVDAGGVTVSYRRLSFAELIMQAVEIKAERTTTLDEIHAQVCSSYGLINDGVLTSGALPGLGTILPGETFEVTITPEADGNLVYLTTPKTIKITWDGVWISQVLTITDLAGFAPVIRYKEQVASIVVATSNYRKYSDDGVTWYDGENTDYPSKLLCKVGGIQYVKGKRGYGTTADMITYDVIETLMTPLSDGWRANDYGFVGDIIYETCYNDITKKTGYRFSYDRKTWDNETPVETPNFYISNHTCFEYRGLYLAYNATTKKMMWKLVDRKPFDFKGYVNCTHAVYDSQPQQVIKTENGNLFIEWSNYPERPWTVSSDGKTHSGFTSPVLAKNLMRCFYYSNKAKLYFAGELGSYKVYYSPTLSNWKYVILPSSNAVPLDVMTTFRNHVYGVTNKGEMFKASTESSTPVFTKVNGYADPGNRYHDAIVVIKE